MAWEIEPYDSCNKDIRINVEGVLVRVDHDDVDHAIAVRVAEAISNLSLGPMEGYEVICAWDIGQEGLVFTSWKDAQDWAVEALEERFKGGGEDEYYKWPTLNSAGLILIQELDVQ